ncbi:beta-defensin 108B [Trichechus inunguis]|uniref:Beta-defensin 108B n=1 Tax=Trichechus manatus latirostris TaxID=127582 RepID=A0A2Y9RKP9_TRIMA|nr:beta-defensin 108B [Trichechus manatus latirostris]
MGIAVLLFTIFIFMNQVLPARGKFKEVCERPNGFCREFCIETEILVGKCLDRRLCCMPLLDQPKVESTESTKSAVHKT